MYLKKKELLGYINNIRNEHIERRNEGDEYDQFANDAVADWLGIIYEHIQSGAFDADNSEVQRLRAENERYRKAPERIAETDIPYAPMTDHSVIRFAELVKCVICKTIAYPNGRWKKTHYGDVCPDCRSGRRINAPEKVGTEEWRHKYFGAEWPKAEGDENE